MRSTSLGNKVLSHAILILLLISATPLVIHVSSENVSAVADTHTWDGGGANALASTGANWDQGDTAPIAGDSALFNAGALPCTWDLAITLEHFLLYATYSGVVTQTVSFGTSGSFSINAGTFSGGAGTGCTVTCGGSYSEDGGTMTSDLTSLILTGASKTIYSLAGWRIGTLNITGSYTMASSYLPVSNFINSGSLTLTGTSHLLISWYGSVVKNSGTLASTDTAHITVVLINADPTFTNTGVWGAETLFTLHNAAAVSRIVTLGGNCQMGDVAIESSHATFTLTFDLSANNYALSATDITIGTRGILMGRASTIISSGNWDSTNGTFYQNSSSVAVGGYAKIASDQQFHNLTVNGTGSRLFVATGDSMRIADNLTVNAGCSASLQNNSYIMQSLVNNGAIIQNSKRLNITGSSSTPLTGYGTFDGDLYLNGSSASSYEVQTGLPMGNLYTDRDTKINLDSTRYLQIVPASTEFVSTSISSYGTEAGYAARWTATSTGPVTYTVIANANELYDIWVDHTTRIGVVQTSADGVVQFTYSGPFSTHEFTVSKSGGPPTSLGASFSYSISGNQVSFMDKSYGGVSMWVWDFGDGTGSTSQSPTHKYSKSGEYVVSLTVYDSKGHSSTAKTTITLELGPDFPIERAPGGWNVWVSEKLTVSISALAFLVFGTWVLLAGYFPPLLPLMTPKTKKILGLIIIAIGLYWFVFVDNSHSWLGWGSV
jgi:PKD repeat protein